ncbi:MAG: hypothetical protein P8K73_03385 [Methylophilaceae bacterium]|jgi:hypothetical protein|nr:hypothetical protein [Methylophilaceae bacterium]
MITSKDKYIKTSGLIIDARSITQLIYINAVFGKLFSSNNTFLIWKGSKNDLKLASKLFKIPKNFYIFDINSSDKNLAFNFKNVRQIKNLCKKIIKNNRSNTLCTCFASGFYFDFLKNLLQINDNDVIQFDDGLINGFVQKKKYRLLRFLVNLIHGVYYFPSKYALFSDQRFNKIFTSINPKNIVDIKNKNIFNITELVTSSFIKLSNKYVDIKMPGSALIMTAPTIEGGRMTKGEYRKLILLVYSKLKNFGVNEIYLSKHPSEKKISDSLYKKLGFNFRYINYPSELIMLNKNISLIVNPINSTMLMSEFFGLLKNKADVISYVPNKSPFADIRIAKINKILKNNNVNHHLIDRNE